MIASIYIPLWTLPAAVVVVCFVPSLLKDLWTLWRDR